MRIKRAFISIIFLFVYSIGFAHDVIPYHFTNCTSEANIFGIEHSHHHHSHNANETEHSSHTHIQHANHYDQDWYDLLVCILDGIEHRDDTCQIPHNLLSNNRVLDLNKLSKTQIAIILTSAISLKKNSNESLLIFDSRHFKFNSPYLKQVFLRGPPLV